MKMESLVPPVVVERPVRGREMQTTAIPTDMFDTMRLMSAKKTRTSENLAQELKKPKEGTAEFYHEGYVDGRKYLVPDSNLEAMKDIINFKMRPRRSTRYKHQTSYEISDYDHFRGKIDGLLFKMDKIKDLKLTPSEYDELHPKEKPVKKDKSQKTPKSEEESESTTEEESEGPSEEEPENVTEEVENKDEEEAEKEPEEEAEKEPEEAEPSLKKEPEEFKAQSELKHLPPRLEAVEDFYRIRFLVSGHFTKDKKPIYIIQEYNGKSDLFKDQKADFFSKKKDKKFDVFMSGKFFNENILEEQNGKPVALKMKPEKIIIEENKSKIYYKYFEDIYKTRSANIALKGQFLKSKKTNRITPFLTLDVKPKSVKQVSSADPINNKGDKVSNLRPKTVLVYKPKSYNPFSIHLENNKYEDDRKNFTGIKPLQNGFTEEEQLTDEKLSTTVNNFQQEHLTHSSFSNSLSKDENVEKEEVKAESEVLLYQTDNLLSSDIDMEDNAKTACNASTSSESNSKKEQNSKGKSFGEGFLKMLKESTLYKLIFAKKNPDESFKLVKLQNEKGKKENDNLSKENYLSQKEKRFSTNDRNENISESKEQNTFSSISPKAECKEDIKDKNML